MTNFFSRTGLFGNETQVPEPEPIIPPPKEPVLTNPPAETTGKIRIRIQTQTPKPLLSHLVLVFLVGKRN